MPPQPPQIPSTSSSLVFRIKNGDQAAWVRVESLYHPLLRYWCDLQKVSDNDVDDIVQDVFRTVHRYVTDFIKHKDKICFRPWLRKITQSRIVDFRERNKDNPIPLSETSLELVRFAFVSKSPDPKEEVEEETEKQILYRQVLELIKSEVNDNTWEAFWLTTVACEDSETVAQKLGMTAANVRKAKSNIKKRIIVEFEDLI